MDHRSGPVRRRTLRLLIDRVTDQAEFDLGNVRIPKIIDEIAPRVGDPADPRNEGDDAADLQSLRIHRQSTDQQHAYNLELGAEVHQEVHRELEAVDPHVQLEHALNACVVGLVTRAVASGSFDDADAQLPDDLDARPGAPVHRTLHQRNEDQLGDEQDERRARHPQIDMDQIGQHRTQDASLQQGLGNAPADETADRLDFGNDHRGLNPFRLQARCSGRIGTDQDMHPAAQVAGRALTHPAAVNIEDELGAPLRQDGTGIDGGEDDDESEASVLDEVVDDPAL